MCSRVKASCTRKTVATSRSRRGAAFTCLRCSCTRSRTAATRRCASSPSSIRPAIPPRGHTTQTNDPERRQTGGTLEEGYLDEETASTSTDRGACRRGGGFRRGLDAVTCRSGERLDQVRQDTDDRDRVAPHRRCGFSRSATAQEGEVPRRALEQGSQEQEDSSRSGRHPASEHAPGTCCSASFRL